eukprot:gene5311-20130_t
MVLAEVNSAPARSAGDLVELTGCTQVKLLFRDTGDGRPRRVSAVGAELGDAPRASGPHVAAGAAAVAAG